VNITRGIIPTAKKVVIYGPEGIGKTTFAAQFPGAVFLDTEGSTVHMDVARLDTPITWADILATVDWAIENHSAIGTFVIDTMDWAEAMAFRDVCKEKKVSGIEDVPYGKGYVFAKDKIRDLLSRLDRLKDAGTNIVLTAHAIVRKFEQPDEMGSYDRYSLKLNEKNISPLIKEWCDLLLFANYRTDVVTTQDGKKKATGGRMRVMYTTHAAAWDAKNRFSLPDELPFKFESIAHLFGDAPAPAQAPQKEDAASAAEVPEKPPVTPPPAKVSKSATVKKKAAEALPDRPVAMQSEDRDKDIALAILWERMAKQNLADPLLLQAVVGEKEYYPAETAPRDYDTDFITDCLLEAWEPVSKRMMTLKNDLPF
jgi:hypothetical protein